SDRDLFTEEQTMATMSFGEHIEELRVRLILALIGLFVGVIAVFIPPPEIGWRVMKSMEAPAATALEHYYRNEYEKKTKLAEETKAVSPTLTAMIPMEEFASAIKQIAPKLELPPADQIKGKKISFPLQYMQPGVIEMVKQGVVQDRQSLISL